jgi:hypothetical protein
VVQRKNEPIMLRMTEWVLLLKEDNVANVIKQVFLFGDIVCGKCIE